MMVGPSVGSEEGASVGARVAPVMEGFCDIVGTKDGSSLGISVGVAVGKLVGFNVGASVGGITSSVVTILSPSTVNSKVMAAISPFSLKDALISVTRA